MKPKYAAWANLSHPRKTQPPPPPIRILDLPGFREIEDMVHLRSDRHGNVPPEVEQACHKLSKKTFGATEEDTKFRFPPEFWDLPKDCRERYAIEDEFEEHELKFETADTAEDEQVELLKRLGLDFTNELGRPLHCLRFFARQAEAAAKKIAGRMPDRAAAQTNAWQASLEADAQAFMRGRRARG